jgi:hypothetical protein
MARIADWLDLARATFQGLHARDMGRLYDTELSETMKSLTADHRDAIEGQKGTLRRYLRTASAVVYGLAKRLAPQRRLIFAAALIITLLTLFSHLAKTMSLDVSDTAFLLLPILLLSFLLALELIDKIRFRDELVLARELQKGLIPEELPVTEGYELAAYNSVANTVGGDIYDFVPLPDGRLAILFGDASGHGMAAGLLMAVAHAAFRTQLEVDPAPEAIAGSLNRILCRTGGRRSFFACTYLLLERDGSFQAFVAGHPPVLQMRSDGNVAQRIGTGSYPLGIRLSLGWTIESGALDINDSLVLYSDGLVEARGRDQSDYGYDRVEQVAAMSSFMSASGILDGILSDWNRFTDQAQIDDDVSLAVIRRIP